MCQSCGAWAAGRCILSGDRGGWESYLVINPVHSQSDEKALAITEKSEHGGCDECVDLRAVFRLLMFIGFLMVCHM